MGDEAVKPSRALAKRRLACENSQFFVYFDDLTHHGHHAQDYLVVAPKQVSADLVTGVAVLPIVDGKFGLLKIYRHAIQSDSWEIPRGFIDAGESDLTAALRELTEETGLSCDRSQIKSLGFVTPDAGVLAARVHVHVALGCTRIQPYSALELGHREFCLFNPAEIEELIVSSDIQDPCTAISYYKYMHNNCFK
jgi:ADP-ribose pyrophosphatase